MKQLSWGSHSRTLVAPPRGELLVVCEESFDPPEDEHMRWLELFRTLPPPFQRVLDVEVESEVVKVWLPRFIGVEGRSLVRALEATGRVLPIDVCLTLADVWGRALLAIPPGNDGWRTSVSLGQLGVDVRGELVLTCDEPNHVLGRMWVSPRSQTRTGGSIGRIPESMSPETARGLELTEATRVYSLAIVLLSFLEGRKQFGDHESVLGMLSAIVLQGLKWGTPRHPHLPREMEEVLRRATQREPGDRLQTIDEFLAALHASAGVAPATEQRMIDVLLGISPELQSCLEKLEPEALPDSWRQGGVLVLQDRLLERLVPITALPAART